MRSLRAHRAVDFFPSKGSFGLFLKDFDILLKRIRALKANAETFFQEECGPFFKPLKGSDPIRRPSSGGQPKKKESITILQEKGKKCVKFLPFCLIVRVIARFDKGKGVFPPKFAIVNERKTSCRKLE